MRNRHFLAAYIFLFALLGGSVCRGQHWFQYSAPPRDMNWELFAPVNDYLFTEDEHRDPGEGYFFNSGRGQYWIMRPERAAIGVAGVTRFGFWANSVDYRYTAITNNVDGAVVPANQSSFRVPLVGSGEITRQFNAVDDAYAAHASGWGNHFEIGWVEDNVGWMLNVTQGVDLNRTDTYGVDDKRRRQLGAAQGLDGIDGIPDPDGTGAGTVTNPVAPVAGFQAILAIDGLLDVPVIFEDPFDLLVGFTDQDSNQAPDDRNGDGVINATDLVPIAVVFDSMRVQNSSHINSVELSAIRRKKRLAGGGSAEFFLGARYFELDDRFDVVARGGVLADTAWNNRALNRIVGPHFGMRIAKSSNRWTSTIQGSFTAGGNFLSVRQDGFLGNHLVTNFPGVPEALGANTIMHRLSDERFSPIGEVGYSTSLLLTRGVALKAAWNGMVIGGVSRGANTVIYRIPQLGIRNKSEETFAHGVTVSLEINR